jgi:hypothetical protein
MTHLTSPGQHALLSAEERKSALLQIMITVQVAAKLAESAHLDAVTHNEPGGGGSGDTERIRAKTESLKAEVEKVEKEVEMKLAETERLRAEVEAGKVGKVV